MKDKGGRMKLSFVRVSQLILMLVAVGTSTWLVQAQGDVPFNQELYDKFVAMRAGAGAPVYWYCVGEVYSYPEGKFVARMEGIDTARLVRGKDELAKATQLNRKIFVYRDPVTNEVMRTANNLPVTPIAYPYQLITYELRDGKLQTFVEQGSGARLQKIDPGTKTSVRRFGDTVVYSAPLFLNIETPRGKYEAYENYDFWVQPAGAKVAHPFQLSWNRYGDLPPFFGSGKSVTQLVCYRVNTYEELPATIRAYLDREAPLWKQPPKDLAEIRELQKGSGQ